jgi:hypothetical protein
MRGYLKQPLIGAVVLFLLPWLGPWFGLFLLEPEDFITDPMRYSWTIVVAAIAAVAQYFLELRKSKR